MARSNFEESSGNVFKDLGLPDYERLLVEANEKIKKSVIVKVTFNLPEGAEDALTEIYIKRLKSKNKMTRSAIVAEAIFKLWERENENNRSVKKS